MKNQTSPLAPRRQRDYAVRAFLHSGHSGRSARRPHCFAGERYPSNAFPAFSALITGGFYSGMKTFGNVLYYAVPIIMTGLGVGFGFKASIFNIGGAGRVHRGRLLRRLYRQHLATSPEHSDGSFRCWPA